MQELVQELGQELEQLLRHQQRLHQLEAQVRLGRRHRLQVQRLERQHRLRVQRLRRRRLGRHQELVRPLFVNEVLEQGSVRTQFRYQGENGSAQWR